MECRRCGRTEENDKVTRYECRSCGTPFCIKWGYTLGVIQGQHDGCADNEKCPHCGSDDRVKIN